MQVEVLLMFPLLFNNKIILKIKGIKAIKPKNGNGQILKKKMYANGALFVIAFANFPITGENDKI